ncbi:MAG: magnesium transporter CorA family protein, partial [Muribaculaceae bacterium]|nr:magnesium transporter CorA family protein [Muribaculaceae bacterium]
MRQFYVSDNGYKELAGVDSYPWGQSPAPGERKGRWVNVELPDADDLEFMREVLGVPVSFLDDLRDVDERPRIDREGDWTLAIIRIPVAHHDGTMPYSTVPLGVMSSGDISLSVCFFPNPIMSDFVEYSVRKSLNIECHTDFLIHMLFSAAYWYLSYLKEMNHTVPGEERGPSQQIQNSDLLRLLQLQNSLVMFNTSIKGNKALMGRLYNVYGNEFDPELYADLEIEMKQADNTVTVYTEILEATMGAYGSIISNNVNLVMKRMTGITIILMVPTLVASVYG